ncbi:hypothetical protein IC620_16125 [Hazenella sp. IB182357]|uniref:Uncharacterized protein n=1 Tax=Polycladospora coralii TaxID=2771432 RepID=A0A926NCS8_9BACL|nr:hypothetical protein [Polycladospora coralii]MBD1373872.1 hypothetical protein [Polycladospora coralii]
MLKPPDAWCSVCGTQRPLKLCDFVVGYSWITAKDEEGNMIGSFHETCDRCLCKDCVSSLDYGGWDFCPEHYEMLDKIELKKSKLDKENKVATHDYQTGYYELWRRSK